MPNIVDLFSHSPEFTLFHTPAWLDVFTTAFSGWRNVSQIFTLPDTRQVWLPLLETNRLGPWRWLESMPGAVFGGPVVSEGSLSRNDLRFLLQQIGRNTGFINLNLDPYHPCANPTHIPRGIFPLTTHILNLEAEFDTIQSRFHKMTHRHVRRAQREEITVRIGTENADFMTYYQLTELAAHHWNLTAPPFSPTFYQALASLADNRVKLWLAELHGQPIGGLITIHYTPDRVLYWGSALDQNYSRLSPTKLLQYEAIRTACESGATIYNMGPSVGFDGTPLDGVRQLKESFGAQPHDYAVVIITNPWAMRARAVRDRLQRLFRLQS